MRSWVIDGVRTWLRIVTFVGVDDPGGSRGCRVRQRVQGAQGARVRQRVQGGQGARVKQRSQDLTDSPVDPEVQGQAVVGAGGI